MTHEIRDLSEKKESVNSQQRLQRQKIAKAISELSFCLKARLGAKLLTWK